MLILPTMGRPDSLRRFITAYQKTEASLPVHVVFDADDAARYNGVETPKHWRRISAPAGTPLGGIFTRLFEKYPDEQFYGMVADDVVPETRHWDTALLEACHPDKIAWGWDGIQNERLPVHPFIGGALVRKLGWWAAPGLKHWFVDNVWKAIADALNCGVYLPEVRMPHYHFLNGKAQFDRTYQQQPNHGADAVTYEKFMREEFPKVIVRLA